MAKFPMLPLYTDAFIADTQHLSTEEVGAYMLMLMAAWRSPNCTLPNDDAYLAAITRLGTRRWKRCRNTLLAFWRQESDQTLSQKRLSEERDKALKYHQAQQSNSRKRKSFKNQETGGSMDLSTDGAMEGSAEGSTDDPRNDPPNDPSIVPSKIPLSLSPSLKKESYTPPSVPLPRAPARDPSTAGGVGEEEGKPSPEQKLAKLEAIFPGCGANITNLARFSDWERWNYNWALDVEPTLREVAESQGPGWLPTTLLYFDKPIARHYHARVSGHIPTPRRSKYRTEEEIRSIIARAGGSG